MKIDKVIVSCDNSHYQYYWPIIAKVCKKNIKATPVLFKIGEEESDFFFDGHGLVKNVKALPEVSTGIQSLFYRMYGTKLFPDDVCLISDIDMMLLSHDYFQGTIQDFDENSIVVYSSDAYDKSRNDFDGFFTEDVYGMCYNAAKGKIFEEVLDLSGEFSDFVERLKTYNIEKGLEWYGDEIYLTNRVNLYSQKYQVHKLKRGYEEEFVVRDRIEKWQFPVEFVIPEMVKQNSEHGNYSEKLLREGYYKDCHCVRPYGWYENEIHNVANISCEKNYLFETISGEDYSTVDDRCLYDNGCIVDVGCLHWDWSNFFIGKKRVIGIDPFENEKTHTELFKGVLGTFDGSIFMENRGIESTMIGQQGGEEVIVKKWKTFIQEYNIDKISVLKLNIEGAEYELLNSLDDDDFENIDQIAVSFHDWMVPEWKEKTNQCINFLKLKNYDMTKINESWGWFLFKKKKKDKVCYVTNFWLGKRRFEHPEYKKDNLYFIKQQIKCLETYKQDLTKIIFNFNITSEHYKYFSEIFSIVPKQIQGAEVEINIRENIGISYGAWSDIFAKYTSEYDYYIFNEDDYFFVQDKWDTYLVNKYNSYEDCGYLCMVVQEPLEWNKFKKHSGSSNGIASTESLNKVFKKFNKLPHISHKQDDAYEGWGDVQLDFTFVFTQIGLNVYDVRDDYSILFQKSSPDNPEIQNWRYFQWNSNYLNVSPFYFEETFSYWSSFDLEFTQEYKITSTEESMYCYNNKLPYHDNEYDENGEFIGWVRKEYPENI